MTGQLSNLTGYSGYFKVYLPGATSDYLVASSANTTGNLLTLGGIAGTIAVFFPSSALTTANTYLYELGLTDSNNNVSKPIGGQFVINPTAP